MAASPAHKQVTTAPTLLIADETAASFWRFSPGRHINDSRFTLDYAPGKPTSVKDIPLLMTRCHPRFCDASDFALPGTSHSSRCAASLLPPPLRRWHFLVDSPSSRFRTQFAESHLCRRPLPRHSAIRLDQNVSIISPEFSFLRMANHLDILSLIAFGSELCANFYYSREGEGLVIKERQPLTTKSDLAAFLDKASTLDGVSRARKALRYLIPCGRSPREIQSGLVLGLPRCSGGQGAGMPQLNHRIVHPPTRTCPQGYFLCDLFWTEGSVDLEYEGFEGHAGRFLEDSARRNALEALGITVITLTKNEFRELSDIIAIAKRIIEKKGMRWRPPTTKDLERMRALHETVLSWSKDPHQPPSILDKR